ncbi:ERCC4 domain-containing protein [Pseudozyma hubeiensis]|nr:ERCC4 domain-containing protein [Pseudozyma hubeiensis]
MVGALWIESGSDSDSDAASHKQYNKARAPNGNAVAGPSRLGASKLRKSPRRAVPAPASSSSSVIVLSSSQDHHPRVSNRTQRKRKASLEPLDSSGRLKAPPQDVVESTPGQRMAQLLAEASPDTSLPSFRDLLRHHKSRTGATSAHVSPPSEREQPCTTAGPSVSHLASASPRAGSLRRTASQPVASSSQEDPISSHFRASVRRPAKKSAASTALPEVIEIGSDSIADPASEADAAHILQTSSPIRSQFSSKHRLPSSQPSATSPPHRVSAASERLGETRRARSTFRADSAPIVILSSSPPPPSLPGLSQRSLAQAIENIAEEEYGSQNFPPSSFPFEEPPPSPPFSIDDHPTEADATSPLLDRRRARESASNPSTPKKARPMSRTGSLLEALDNLYTAEKPTSSSTDVSDHVDTGDVASAAGKSKDASKSNASPSKAQKAAAAKQAREAKAREREAVKLAKAQAAAEKKRFLEVNRLRTSKADTMRELIVDLDRTLFSAGQPFAGCQDSITTRFEEEGASVQLCDSVVAPPLVRFRRKVKARWNAERRHWTPLDREEVRREGMVIVYIDAKEIVQQVAEGGGEGLESWYGDLQRRLSVMNGGREPDDGQQQQVFLICQGLVKHYSRLRANENRAYTARIRQQLAENQLTEDATTTASDAAPKPARRKGNAASDTATATASSSAPPQAIVERSLLQLKLIHRCYVIHAASLVDGVEWLHQLTSDLSLKPYKSLRDTHLSFAVDTGRNTTSSSSAAIYTMMLQQIPRVTPAISQSITTIYPSLHSLVSAYQRCKDETEEKGLLSSVQVVSNKDGTERRGNRTNLGLQLSKRIHAVVRGRNAELLINNPTKD